jgi:hypothetical protein
MVDTLQQHTSQNMVQTNSTQCYSHLHPSTILITFQSIANLCKLLKEIRSIISISPKQYVYQAKHTTHLPHIQQTRQATNQPPINPTSPATINQTKTPTEPTKQQANQQAKQSAITATSKRTSPPTHQTSLLHQPATQPATPANYQ